jgi:hypothetical protein
MRCPAGNRCKASARQTSPEQHVCLAPGHAQPDRRRVGSIQACYALPGKLPDHIGPANSQVRRFWGRGERTAL